MAFGPKVCACCGADEGIEEHHLYWKSEGCPDDLTVYLCHVCHGRTHEQRRRLNNRVATARGLARAKARGVKLGNPNWSRSLKRAGAASTAGAPRRRAAKIAAVLPAVQALRAQGVTSTRALARGLTAKGVPGPRGGAWSSQSLTRLLRAAGELEQIEPVPGSNRKLKKEPVRSWAYANPLRIIESVATDS